MRVSATLGDDHETSVTRTRCDALRRAWLQIHLWLGLTLGVLGAVVGVTGSLLVFDGEIDRALNPQRYATSGANLALPYSEYAQRAARAVSEQSRTVNLRLPAGEGAPVVALVRAPEGASLRRVYLDPPSGRVLDAPIGRGLIGWSHDLHESLTLREYNGRGIVGAVGLAMLVSSLSGIYLWWPRKRITRRDFGFRRGLALSRNLHQTLGLYASLVLAMLSFTGAVIAFPDASRAIVGAFAAISPSPRGIESKPSDGRLMSPDDAAALARARLPGATVTGVGFPAGPRGAYRIALREPGDDSERGAAAIFIDPRAGTVLRQIDRASRTGGDAFLAYQRPLHEGDPLGLIGRIVIAIIGLLPAMFVVTGTIMWLAPRPRRRAAKALSKA